MDPAIRNISFKIMWTGAMFYTACWLKTIDALFHVRISGTSGGSGVLSDTGTGGGAAYRRFSSNRRAQSRYGIQQSEVASMVGFDRIRRQFHRHKSYQRQRLERQIPGRIAVER